MLSRFLKIEGTHARTIMPNSRSVSWLRIKRTSWSHGRELIRMSAATTLITGISAEKRMHINWECLTQLTEFEFWMGTFQFYLKHLLET